MSADTANALTDFDFCLAVSEVGLNTQLDYAWKAWRRRGRLDDTISIVDAGMGLEATVEPLTVTLDSGDGASEQVQVSLRLPSGEVTYVDGDGRRAAQEIVNWEVSFLADVGTEEVDVETLAAIDPDASQAAAAVIAAAQEVPDAAFSIEYVFLRLTDLDLLADSYDIRIPRDVPQAARAQALRSLNALLADQLGNFLLGTVVRRNHREAVPTFALTDFILDIHPDAATPGASTLAYLGEFAHRPLPADHDAARRRLTDAWVRPGQLDGTEGSIAGTMAISKRALFDNYLIQRFTDALGVSPTFPEARSWTFRGGTEQGKTSKDIITRKLRIRTGWEITITIDVGRNTASLSGRIGAAINYDGYTLDLGIIGPQHTEWMHSSGHRDIAGSMTVKGSGQGADYLLVPTLTHTIGDLAVDMPGHPVGGAKVLEAFAGLFREMGLVGSTPAEQLRSAMKTQVEQVRDRLVTALAKVQLSMDQHAFIPPGGGAYALSRPRFSAAGDLLLDVIYQAP